MTITKITNYEERAISRLITQYKNKSNIETFIKSFSEQGQEIEDVIFQLREERNITNAIGIQLDNLGDILKQPRQGLSDDDYRALLLVRVAQYGSDTTIESIINIAKLASNAVKIKLDEYYPGSFNLQLLNVDPIITTIEIRNVIQEARAAGVEFFIVYYEDDYFGFSDDPDALGFDDLTGIVGGTFGTL